MIRNTKNTLRAIFLGTAIIALWAVFGLNDARAGTIIQRPLYFGLNQGLVGFWSFDAPDMAGNSAYDRSGSNNTGTLTNGPTRQIGKIGQALSFDGVNDVVSVLDSVSLDSTRNAFTVSAWIYDNDVDDGVDDDRHILDKGDEGTNVNNTFRLGLSDSKQINIAIFDGSSSNTAYGPTPVSFQTWSHVTAVFNGNNITVYLNGVAGTPVVKTIGTLFDAGNLAIGRQSAADCASPYSSCWKGQIDDVRVYNRALSSDEIKRLYNMGATTKFNVSQKNTLNNGLVGLWTFDGPDMAGVAAYDRSGNNNTGTLTNGPTRAIGRIGQALNFDGADDNVSMGDVLDLIGSPLSISVWVNPRSTPNAAGIVDKLGTGGNNRLIMGGSGTIAFGIRNADSVYESVTTTVPVPLNSWTHLVATYDNVNTGKIYFNGSLDITKSNFTVSRGNVGYSLRFGYSNNNAVYFPGLIDDVRIYNRALSPDEIKRLYNMGATTKFNVSKKQDPSLNQGLVGLWTFDAPDMAGVAAYDRSGNNNNGTLTNGVKKAIGKIGQALNFDGVNDYVGNINFGSISTSQLTQSYWIKKTEFSGIHRLDNTGAFQAGFTGNTFFVHTVSSSGTDNNIPYSSIPGMTTNEWHHLVITRDTSGDNKIKVYLDGTLKLTGNLVNAANGAMTLSTFEIGSGSGTQSFDGLIDEVRVYNRALSPDEIKRLYNMGR